MPTFTSGLRVPRLGVEDVTALSVEQADDAAVVVVISGKGAEEVK